MKGIIIDDEEHILFVFRSIIEKYSKDVIILNNLENLFNILEEQKPIDYILSDVVISSNKNIFSICKKIRENYPQIYIALMSGHNYDYFEQAKIVENVKDSSVYFDEFIQKPFSIMTIFNNIEKKAYEKKNVL